MPQAQLDNQVSRRFGVTTNLIKIDSDRDVTLGHYLADPKRRVSAMEKRGCSRLKSQSLNWLLSNLNVTTPTTALRFVTPQT